MSRLIKFFIDNYKLTIILSLILLAFGGLGLLGMNSESYPTVNFATATIDTRYTGATPNDIETKITKPIEDEIRTVSGLKDVRSVSRSGFSSIKVRVDMDNEDEEEVLDDLQKAVEGVSDLPLDLRDDPVYLEVNSEEFPAIEIAVVGSNENRARDKMVDILKEELEDSKRVKNARLVGFRKRQFNIRLNEKKMESLHIGLEEVLTKIQMRNVNVPGGEIFKDGIKKLIRVEGKVKDVTELQDLVIRSNFSGNQVLLKDIADVKDSQEDANILADFNGENAVFVIVNKKGGADTLRLVAEVDAILERFKKQYEGQFEIYVYNNEAEKVKNKMNILKGNAFSGLALVIIFLLIFLPGKIGVVASLSLPLAVMGTIGFMPGLGMNFDAITILALVIALGMLVDNSVVISENFARLRSQGMKVREAAITSVEQLWLPISITAFTTIAAFLPMLMTKGIMGEFIKYIPIVVSLSLLLSLVESFFLLPMRLIFAGKDSSKLKDADEIKKGDWFDKFITRFEDFMRVLIKRRGLVFFAFGGIILGALLLMTLGNTFILFPADQTEIYVGRLEMPRGTRIEETRQELIRLSKEIKSTMGDDLKWLTTRAGASSMGPTDPMGATGDAYGLILMYASDYAKYNVVYTKFLKKLSSVKSSRAVDLTFKEMVNGPPVGEPITATFRSNNSESLDTVVNQVKDELGQVEGILDLRTDDVRSEKEIKVDIDYAKADRLGLSVNAIGNAIRTALSGTMVSQVTLENKDVDLSVRYLDDSRKTLIDIGSVKVMDNRGNLVPISTVAKLRETDGELVVKRFDFKRAKTLFGSVDPALINSNLANQKLTEVFNKISKDYPDVSLVFGGEAEATKESMQSLGQAGLLAAMGIFGLLVFLFRSYLRPLIIMSTIPLGLVGFSIAFFLQGRPVSFLAMIGIIGLAGIIVNSGIVLISFIDQLRAEGQMSLDEILVKASGLRLRAVIVTSLTTVSGLLPTAYGIGGSDAMLVPMTLAMAWGLTSGTLLTLIWVPCAYALLEDFTSFMGRLSFKKKNIETTESHSGSVQV